MLGTTCNGQSRLSVSPANNAFDKCMPRRFRWFWKFDALKNYTNIQGQLFYRDPEQVAAHQHYSKVLTPIVDLGEPFVSVDDGRDFSRPERRQNNTAKFVSLADAVQVVLIVSDSVVQLGKEKD